MGASDGAAASCDGAAVSAAPVADSSAAQSTTAPVMAPTTAAPASALRHARHRRLVQPSLLFLPVALYCPSATHAPSAASISFATGANSVGLGTRLPLMKTVGVPFTLTSSP